MKVQDGVLRVSELGVRSRYSAVNDFINKSPQDRLATLP